MASKRDWPTLSDGRGNGPRQPQQRALAANHDAKQLLAYIKEQKIKVPETVIEFIKNTEATTEVFLTDPLGGGLQKSVEDAVIKATLDLKKDIHAIKTNTENQSPSGRVRSFAEALRQAPPPSYVQSNHGSNSSQGATPSELSRDREIVVKLGDAAGIKRFRAFTSADIRRKAQQARDKACMSTLDQPALGAVQFVAARQLKSGDLSLSLRSAKEAEVARLHRNWVRGLWTTATIRMPSWGVVVHGIPVKAMGDLSDRVNREAIAMQLIAENEGLWGSEVELGSVGAGETIIRLAAAAKRGIRQRIRERWRKQWEREKGAKPTRRLVKAPGKAALKLYQGLSKPHTSILIQMRTQRIGLNHFLYKIKARDCDRCGCGEGSQTTQHVLLQCSRYVNIRKTMLDKLADKGIRGTDYDTLVSDPQASRYLVEFVHQTGLLGQFLHAELTELAPDQEQIGLTATG